MLPPRKWPGLTDMQRAFVEAFEGDAEAAAKAAGYKYWGQAGKELIRDSRILAAIEMKFRGDQPGRSKSIATRLERQRQWTRIMRDERQDPMVRLRASELLGKAQGDFLDRIHHSGDVQIDVIDPYAEKEK